MFVLPPTKEKHCMAKKKLLASSASAAGLLGGGVAGVVLGVPGVSSAQTTTVPDQPTTTVPNDGTRAPEHAPRGDRENCPDKEGNEGQAPSGSSTNASPHRFERRVTRRA
jgi:hypothetical protein